MRCDDPSSCYITLVKQYMCYIQSKTKRFHFCSGNNYRPRKLPLCVGLEGFGGTKDALAVQRNCAS